MRHMILAVLSALLLLMGSGLASGYSIEISTQDPTSGISIGDTIVVSVGGEFDTGTILWSASVGFDPLILQYNRENSFGPEGGYLLYSPASGSGKTGVAANYLTGAFFNDTGCPGYSDPNPGSGCTLWVPAPPHAVWINLISSFGVTQGITGSGSYGYSNIAEMEFEAIGEGNSTIDIIFDVSVGAVILSDGSGEPVYAAPSLGTPIEVNVPEPALVGLSLAALGTVVGLRRRRAMK